MNENLRNFIHYCDLHPKERFWQALRNWSGARKIKYDDVDTFYWDDTTWVGDVAAKVEETNSKLAEKLKIEPLTIPDNEYAAWGRIEGKINELVRAVNNLK